MLICPLRFGGGGLKALAYIKLCENTKNYKYANPGSNKVVYGACEQEFERKKNILDCEYAK